MRRNVAGQEPERELSAEAYDPKNAKVDAVQLGLRGAMASAVAVLLMMCALAAGTSFLIIWLVPPPGSTDVLTEMPWTRLSPFKPEHGACGPLFPARAAADAPPRLRAQNTRHRLHGPPLRRGVLGRGGDDGAAAAAEGVVRPLRARRLLFARAHAAPAPCSTSRCTWPRRT